MLARLEDRPVATALLIGLAAQLLFLFHLGWPTAITFDEVHYVPAARALLTLDVPRNTEHPLFAKELIALGMALFGDNPIGWRIAASLAGSATVMGVFAFVWLLVRDRRAAVIAALLAILNQTLFIEARIAMLDPFLGAFVIWGIVLLLWSMRARTPGQAWRRWIAGGVALGLAVACKWTAAPYLIAAGCGFFWVRWRDMRRMRRPLLAIFSGRDQPHFPGLPAIPALLTLGLVSIAVYFLTFLPAFFYREEPLSLATLLPFQLAMYESQTQVLRAHPYQSSWWTWPLAIRPIWYFYEYDDGAQRGVLLLGNPVIMWSGLVAVLACFWTWVRTRAAAPLAVALLWVFSLAIWAIIPKSLGFYYYYYLSSILLCPPLALALRRYVPRREYWFVGAALIAFLYFYPIIAALPLSGPDAFNHWMWFDSWR